MMKWLYLAVLLVFTAQSAAAQPALQMNGEWQVGLDISEAQGDCSTAAQSILRLKMRAGDYLWQLYTDVALKADGDGGGSDGLDLDVELELIYLKLRLPDVDVSIGKQQISWGVGYTWAPTDVFNSPDPADPAGRRPGVTAAVVRIPAGPLGYWNLVAAEKSDKDNTNGGGGLPGSSDPAGSSKNRWLYGVRRHGNLNGTDWSAIAVDDGRTTILGADAKGDLGIGWHGEVAYFVPRGGADTRLEGVLGGDYSWDGGRILWIGEYLYNSRGAAEKGAYDYVAWLTGREKYLARHYAFSQLTYQYDEFTSIFGSMLANLVDCSAAWTAGTHILLSERWQLSLSATAFSGDEGEEFAAGAIPGMAVNRPGAVLKAQVKYGF